MKTEISFRQVVRVVLATEHALENFLDSSDLDPNLVETVAECVLQAIQVLPDLTYFSSILEKSSTYVQCDLNVDELKRYTALLEDYMDEYGLLQV